MIIILSVLFLALYIGSNIYVPWKLGKLFELKKPGKLYLLFLSGGVSFPLSMILNRFMTNSVTDLYYLVSSIWIGIFFNFLVFLLSFEILKKVIRISGKKSGIIIVIHVLILSVYAVWNAYSFNVNTVLIPIRGLKNDLRIVHISDVHLGAQRGRGYLKKIVIEANLQDPDLVLITGDLVESNSALNMDLLSPLKKLSAPSFFTTGNHESYAGLEKSLKYIRNSGIKVLRNEKISTHNIQLVGLDYMNADENSLDMHKTSNHTIKDILPEIGVSEELPSILMHHSPVGVEYVNRAGIDLMLSGHTHSGQIFPVTLLSRLFFRYCRGLYNYKGTSIYVSRGAGTFGPPMRLGTYNEITMIKLIPEEKKIHIKDSKK